MKRLERIKVLGKRFLIQYVIGVPLETDETGECDSEKQVITVLDGQQLEAEQDTVLHECLHALEDLMGMELTHENIVRLTTGIHALIKDNPSLVSYLRRRK